MRVQKKKCVCKKIRDNYQFEKCNKIFLCKCIFDNYSDTSKITDIYQNAFAKENLKECELTCAIFEHLLMTVWKHAESRVNDPVSI